MNVIIQVCMCYYCIYLCVSIFIAWLSGFSNLKYFTLCNFPGLGYGELCISVIFVYYLMVGRLFISDTCIVNDEPHLCMLSLSMFLLIDCHMSTTKCIFCLPFLPVPTYYLTPSLHYDGVT